MTISSKRRHSRQGFTLLEIMLVVAIIGLLLGAATYYFAGNMGTARDTRVQADIQTLSTSLKLYNATNGFYPTTEQGLKALVTKPDSDPQPTQWHQYIDKLPLDPWQSPYIYVQPGKHNPDSFDISSAGPDRQPNTADDIGNWDKTETATTHYGN